MDFFFLGLAFGKTLDLLYKLIYFTSNEQNKLIVLKIRYILIILTSAPFILIGIDLILNSISNRYEKLTNEIYRIKFSLIVIIILIIIQVAFVIVAFDIFNLQIILICCHIPSLGWIIYTFFYAYRKKNISEINTLIIAIAFLLDLVLYIVSVFLTPIRQKTVGFSPIYTIFAELIDLIIIIIIFFGYIKKPNYISEN